MELEQLVHRPQGDVVDLFEIERRVNLGGHTLQNLQLCRLARERRLEAVTLGHGNCLASVARSS